MQLNRKLPAQCTSIEEVRSEIDTIDSAIIRLIAKRFDYVREVVKYKDNTPGSIEADERRRQVIATRRDEAEAQGLDPDVVADIWNRLIAYFIEEEKKIQKESKH